MSVKQDLAGPDLAARRAQSLGRFMAAAQADAERFHGNAAARAWRPRGAQRRRPSAVMVAALVLASAAVAAGAYLMGAPDPATPSAPVAAVAGATPGAPWFAALAHGDEAADAAALRAEPGPQVVAGTPTAAQPQALLRAPAPGVGEAEAALPVAPMNVPTLPDEGAAGAAQPQDTGYDMGDGGLPSDHEEAQP